MYGRTSLSQQFFEATGKWSDRIKRNGSGFVGAGPEAPEGDSTLADLELEKRKILVAMSDLGDKINHAKSFMAEAAAHKAKTGRYADRGEWVRADTDRRELGARLQAMQRTLGEINRRIKIAAHEMGDESLIKCLREIIINRHGEAQWNRLWLDAQDLRRLKQTEDE